MLTFVGLQVTVPLPGEVVIDDGRPKALQVETAAIKAKNRTLESLFSNTHFKHTVLGMKRGWVFETQDTNQFPHFPEDIQSLPLQLKELIDHAFQRDGKKSVSSKDQLLNSEEERTRKLDLGTMEGWHIRTECVQVSFAESYSHEATLYTTQFVDDFPVHLWLFPPRPDRDSTLSTHSTPSTPSLSPQPHNPDPILSFLAHAPNLIRAELNRAQVLFLMRLKDSITMFKNRLMEFLDTSSFVPPKRTPSPSTSSHTSSSDGLREEPTEEVKAISGCVIVEHVQANILLPSIFTTTKKPQSPTTPRPREEVDGLFPHNDSSGTITGADTSRGATQAASSLTNVSQANPVTVSTSESMSSALPAPGGSQSDLLSTGSNSSLTVNTPATPARISSSESLLDDETGSVLSLPVIQNPRSKITRMYSSASNLANTKSSFEVDNKSPSSISLSAFPNSFTTTSPSPSPHALEEGGLTVQAPTSVSASLEAKPSGSHSSDLDEFVMVADPTQASTEQAVTEVKVTLSPPTKQPVKSGGKAKSKRRLKSPPPLSERKVRSLSPPKSEPEYILCIKVDGIHALPNILTSGEISARCNANSIDVREVKNDKYEAYKEESKFKRGPQLEANEKCMHPVIKARIEIGDQVTRFFPKSVTEADVILILKATGLDVGLLMQNMAVMKDFFDDEFESEQPVPMHIRVDNTKLVILDSPGDSIDHWKSMCVEVNQADIHRGRSLAEGVNVFMDRGQTAEPQTRGLSRSSESEARYAQPSVPWG